ncbi:MAG: carbon-nitrogen hydrolase family protein [Rhodothalassiaceae bacterium]
MSRPPFRAAVVQAGSCGFDTAASLAKLADLAGDAARQGARLAVFPEAFLGGYPKGLDFGARLGLRMDRGRDEFGQYFEAAIALPGPELDRLCQLAADLALTLVVGVIERDGGTLYCTQVFVDETGDWLGKHRKLMPTAMERLVWGQGDGSTIAAHDTPVGRIGGVICWENYMPQLRLAMYAQGTELYCASTVDDRDQWQHAIRHIAYEGRCFVLSACQYLTRAAFPADYACSLGDDPATVLIRGGSSIVSPLGQVLAGPIYEQETVLVADLDPADIARGKYDLDVAGHYARPDVFSLNVNATERPGVSLWQEGPSEDLDHDG